MRWSLLFCACLAAACGPANVGTSGSSGAGSSTTGGVGPSPSAFSFVSVTNVALNTPINSANITIGGLSASATISVTGGQYQVGANSWTSTSGTISNAQTVRVKHTSSSTNATDTVTTLTIGAVSAVFKSTTVSAGNLPSITQNALKWTQDNANPVKNWTDANAYCTTTTTINGLSGWVLPTKDQLLALRAGNSAADLGWNMNGLWTSNPYVDAGGTTVAGFHLYVPMQTTNATPASFPDDQTMNFSCVHP